MKRFVLILLLTTFGFGRPAAADAVDDLQWAKDIALLLSKN
jgi:hypothetical protein